MPLGVIIQIQFFWMRKVEKKLLNSCLSDNLCLQILRCGPPPMNKAIAGHCDALGYTKEMQFQF